MRLRKTFPPTGGQLILQDQWNQKTTLWQSTNNRFRQKSLIRLLKKGIYPLSYLPTRNLLITKDKMVTSQ